MKVVIQRTTGASVKVDNRTIGEIRNGYVILVGFTANDSLEDVKVLADKMIHLRIFEDENNKMNLSLIDIGGSILSISQFTLYADVKKGRRPSFAHAADPNKAEQLYDQFNDYLREKGIEVATGEFGAMMDVQLINHGPVTITMESTDGKLVN